jgi:spore coat polysaccharide biosynthesis protein SpsF
MKIGAIVLARLDSRRLPGKALRDLCGKPLVQWAIDVCLSTPGLAGTILATTDRVIDDALADYARRAGIGCLRGDCDDVAGRFLAGMEKYGFDAAIRFNGDSPLQRPSLLGEGLDMFCNSDVDLVSNVMERRFPYGISVEVVGRPAMRDACASMTQASHREHVTSYFYDHPDRIRIKALSTNDPTFAGVQLAVDDESDFERVAWIMSRLTEPVLEAPLTEIVALAHQYDERGGAKP